MWSVSLLNKLSLHDVVPESSLVRETDSNFGLKIGTIVN